MRACATVNLLAVLGFVTAATISACSGSSPQEANAPDTQAGAPSSSAEPAKAPEGAAATSGTAAPGTSAAAEPAKAARKEPQTTADCRELLSEITNEPPSDGVVMNNAQPEKEAATGSSKRLQPMIDLMKQKRDGFRCCFDLWAKNNPGAQGKVALVLELAPDGTLKSAKVKPEDSDIKVPEVEACMVDLAKSLTYPKSPDGKVTVYTHPFNFKARNK